MKAIRLDAVGPPENLQLVEEPVPEIDQNGVLIKVHYAGLTYSDCELRRGTYYIDTKLPYFPGREVSGTIEKVGASVTRWQPGQRVMAMVLSGGGYAEYVHANTRRYTFPGGNSFPAADIFALPDHVSFSQGLVYLINYRLAHILFHSYLAVPPAATVLVHGAAGGFGSVLTAMARANGNTVIALSRTAEEVEFCLANGAHHSLDTNAVDYVAEVMDITGGKGVDVSLNGVSGETLDRDAHAVRALGEIAIYGYAGGRSRFNPWAVNKSLTVRTFSADDFLAGPALQRANEAMYACFASGTIADVTRTFRLEDAAAAQAWIDSGRVLGKIALQIR
jgi:NADPH2:quinone reductase